MSARSKTGFWRPRVNIDVEPEVFETLQLIPHGMKKQLFTALCEDIAHELRTDREGFLTAVLTRSLRVKQVMKMEEPK